uniref:Uncharacterized protein n=1 Tax=Rhizophora mucronata TaxID=61149 RepID=A0A2P2NEG7_RHIMU
MKGFIHFIKRVILDGGFYFLLLFYF